MSHISGTGMVRMAPGVAASFLLGIVVLPSSARASCGDYVLRGNAPPSAVISPQTDISSTQEHSPMDPGQHPTPCSGPNCSRGSLPLPNPSSINPTGGDDWALETLNLPLFALEPAISLFADDPQTPCHRNADVYHPPR